jgi:hypothetical protein
MQIVKHIEFPPDTNPKGIKTQYSAIQPGGGSGGICGGRVVRKRECQK